MKKMLCSAALCTGALLVGAGPASADAAPPPPAPSYRVAPGDSLSRIAQTRLGASQRWVEIFALNRDVLRHPDQVEVGQVLKIPSAPVPVPADVLAGVARPAPPNRPAGTARVAVTRRPASVARGTGGSAAGASLAAIRRCESGGNYRAVSAGGRYRGAYQFDQRTWQSVGGTGDPAGASPGEQDARARALLAQRGSSPWANCS